ncbi:PREDICTED: uncharacterized protein LOC105570613 isoform X3 [Vollenhovia emeryi]|uniref:uncharacterized protein LOC105570613 isoform X3 n=1 Tax=Vollenhovia emeryi TaxID=411798 RepID=UPI0005F571D9|nr:PREDICTED: uncharacterized protein LOC105570613 isoform X3 [Vollenhovia emeryi]
MIGASPATAGAWSRGFFQSNREGGVGRDLLPGGNLGHHAVRAALRQERGFFYLLALLVRRSGGHAGLAKGIVLSTVVLHPGVATKQTLAVLRRGRSAGGTVLTAYCIERAGTTRSLPIGRRLGRREPLEFQAGELRPIRGSSGDGGSR